MFVIVSNADETRILLVFFVKIQKALFVDSFAFVGVLFSIWGGALSREVDVAVVSFEGGLLPLDSVEQRIDLVLDDFGIIQILLFFERRDSQFAVRCKVCVLFWDFAFEVLDFVGDDFLKL